MLFDIANIKLFPFEFHINEFQRMLMKHPTISRKNNEKKMKTILKSSETETEIDSYSIWKQPLKN